MTTFLMTGMEKAIKAAGGQVALAEQLGVSQQAISLWKRRGYAPISRLTEIECQYGVRSLELINPRIIEFFIPTVDHFLY
jgi:hypothetical protein